MKGYFWTKMCYWSQPLLKYLKYYLHIIITYLLGSIIADLLTIMYSLPMYPLKAVLSEINVELYSFTKIDYSVSFFLVKLS